MKFDTKDLGVSLTELNWPIAQKFKGDLQIFTAVPLPQNYEELFCKATNLIAPEVESKKITVFFAMNELRMLLTRPAYGIWYPNIIVYDLAKMTNLNEVALTVCFLEELVHAYFSTFDEIFVGQKVADLFPKVHFNKESEKYEFNLE